MGMNFLFARLGLGLAAISLFGLPLGSLRLNRIVRGIPLDAGSVFGQYSAAYMAVFLAILGLYAFQGHRERFFVLRVVPWLLMFVPGFLPVALSSAAISFGSLPGMGINTETVRISLGSGYWLLLAGTLLMQSTSRHKTLLILLTGGWALLTAGLGWAPHLALYKEFLSVRGAFYSELKRHIALSFISAFCAVAPGIILGYWAHKSARAKEWVFGTVNLFQVIPTLSLLGLAMIPLAFLAQNVPLIAGLGIKGIGFAPAFIVLALYCLLPITANACAGFDQIGTAVTESAEAMGMTQRQIFARVTLPLALPVIFSGIRTAVTQNIGNTILAGLIGGGGMGALIFLGLAQSASDLVILGTLPVVILALAADVLGKRIEERLTRRVGVSNDSSETGS